MCVPHLDDNGLLQPQDWIMANQGSQRLVLLLQFGHVLSPLVDTDCLPTGIFAIGLISQEK
jgi:hypothetical protein